MQKEKIKKIERVAIISIFLILNIAFLILNTFYKEESILISIFILSYFYINILSVIIFLNVVYLFLGKVNSKARNIVLVLIIMIFGYLLSNDMYFFLLSSGLFFILFLLIMRILPDTKKRIKFYFVLFVILSVIFIMLSNFYRTSIESGHFIKCNKCKDTEDICKKNMMSGCELINYSCQDARDDKGWSSCTDIIHCKYDCPLSSFKLSPIADLFKK